MSCLERLKYLAALKPDLLTKLQFELKRTCPVRMFPSAKKIMYKKGNVEEFQFQI